MLGRGVLCNKRPDDTPEGANDTSSGKYKITPIDTDKNEIPQRKCAKDGVMPRYPFSMMLSGSSGSGKTVLAMNILTKKELYGKYFHYIIVFSPTAGDFDDTYKCLGLPEENFISKFDGAMLDKIIECRKKLISEHGIPWVAKNSRMLIIMDDCIADRQFLESPDALKMFALLRHYLVSVIVMIQSYRKLPKALRLNCNAVAVFPALRAEIDVIKEECCPANYSKKEFEGVLQYCMSDKHSFFYINRHAESDKRIRKNLDEIIGRGVL
jgi:chloramphenicol 3-O-phosphotransferase